MLKNWTKKITKNKGFDYLVYRPAGGGTIEMFDIAVFSKRGVGIGTSLIKTLIKKEKPKVLTGITRASNTNAQEFYNKLGFKSIALPGFYPDEDAVMYLKRCE
jgi:ribosomal protein S18 acetylase RimI-like enzyme